MSAYVVDHAHIDALVRLADAHSVSYLAPGSKWITVGHANRHVVGQMLLDANVTSVATRYRGSPVDNLPGRVDHWWTEPYRMRANVALLEPVAGLKAINAFAYQACEASTWEGSEAWQFCEALRNALIRHLPGYEQAEWSISDPAPDAIADEMEAETDRRLERAAAVADAADRFTAFRDAWMPGGE